MSTISEELWRRCWNEAGALNYRQSAHALQRQLDAVRAALRLLNPEDNGPLLSASMLRANARAGREMLDVLRREAASRGVGARGRGRESRFSTFVRLMFKADPNLPRTPAPWMKAADKFREKVGLVEPSPSGKWWAGPQEPELIGNVEARRRRQWKDVLRRVGAKSRRR